MCTWWVGQLSLCCLHQWCAAPGIWCSALFPQQHHRWSVVGVGCGVSRSQQQSLFTDIQQLVVVSAPRGQKGGGGCWSHMAPHPGSLRDPVQKGVQAVHRKFQKIHWEETESLLRFHAHQEALLPTLTIDFRLISTCGTRDCIAQLLEMFTEVVFFEWVKQPGRKKERKKVNHLKISWAQHKFFVPTYCDAGLYIRVFNQYRQSFMF